MHILNITDLNKPINPTISVGTRHDRGIGDDSIGQHKKVDKCDEFEEFDY
jgi:hypothetical protein